MTNNKNDVQDEKFARNFGYPRPAPKPSQTKKKRWPKTKEEPEK